MKKVIILVLSLAIILGTTTTTYAAKSAYTDKMREYYYVEYHNCYYGLDVFSFDALESITGLDTFGNVSELTESEAIEIFAEDLYNYGYQIEAEDILNASTNSEAKEIAIEAITELVKNLVAFDSMDAKEHKYFYSVYADKIKKLTNVKDVIEMYYKYKVIEGKLQ